MPAHTDETRALERASGGDRAESVSTISRRRLLHTGAALGAGGALFGGLPGSATADSHDHTDGVSVLVFSVTDGFRHASIDYGNAQLESLTDRIATVAGVDEVTIDVIDDPNGDASAFPDDVDELAAYDVVVWNNTTGSPLEHAQREAFEAYIRDGGGYAGIHAAADTHYHWDFYSDLVGAQFEDHPPVQDGEIAVTDRDHPSTRHLPERWTAEDEWYDYDRNPRGDVHVLATLDEDSYDGAGMDGGRADHPIAWCHEVDDGRAWYTGRGHTQAAFDEEAFLEHLLYGICWAGGLVEGDATATVWDSYQRVEITTDVTTPVSIETDPSGRIYVVNLDANVLAIDPDTFETSVALEREFYSAAEDGGHDLAFDPEFSDNGYVYFYYSPTNDALDPDADDPYAVLSRFEVDPDTGTFDEASEVELLRVTTQRETSGGMWGGADYHLAGGVEFGPDGSLYLTTGDNVTPHEHDGFAPIEEGSDPNWMDARGTSGDTADLRGKILRIEPHEDGSYSIPDGNLFPEDEYAAEIDAGTVAPEIYAMGFRNPFRLGVDDETGALYVADMGPDSYEWDTDRGPIGLRTYNRITDPVNMGWPFARLEYPYADFDYNTHTSSGYFDPDGPTNDSAHNDGLTDLPPVDTDSTLAYVATDWQTYLHPPHDGPWETPDEVPHPELADTGVIGGPLFRLDEIGDGGLPPYVDGKWLIAGWNSGSLKLISTDADGDLLEIEPFLSGIGLESPNDFAVGPEGRLYVADWGEEFEPTNPAIYRIEHEPEVVVPQYDEEFVLEGATDGWVGVSPDSIAGETNPTLPVEVGGEYRFEWTNVDGIPHNVAIRDEDEEVLLSTDLVYNEGATQEVSFTATEEMDHYLCEPHPSTMLGDLSIGDGHDDEFDDNLGDPVTEITVDMADGNRFEPQIVHVEEGATVTWEFVGGWPHDTVAYHPDTYGDQRIPDGTDPWQSDLLSQEGETFEHTFEDEGVYDYVCVPHEEAGMVATVVVGWPDPDGQPGLESPSIDMPSGAREELEALNARVSDVLEDGPAADLDVSGDGNPAQDLTGDGLYEDITGDGNLGFNDVVTFFEEHNSDVVQSNVEYFDFSGNGQVGFNDVVALFERL
ncbi:ThuA domain-containing protein [Natronobiforma cellulositropha]|uniref:ThuA domain-containing protein n=1 Tax=Natronobiforma cellulositropha TaxID=1679076 RepID=UPI0021D5EA60|nr:ThuA domain-containing protein [Natronobiforma cellulositropha]